MMNLITLASWLDDHCNPILVKEVRQSLHNRAMLTVMGGLMGLQLGGIYFMLTLEVKENFSLGAAFFYGDMFLFALCSGVLAFLCALRFFRERRGRALDLMFTTPLSPFRLAWGKFLSAVVMEIQIYALCLPFMMVSYYMRGIGLVNILAISSLIFICSLPLIALGLCLAATGWRTGILALPVVIAVALLWTGCILVGWHFDPVAGDFFWIRGAVIAIWCTGLLLSVLQSMLGCSAGNRILGLRVFVVLSAFLLAPLFYEFTRRISCTYALGEELPSWEVCGLYAVAAIALIAVLEPLVPSRRILISAPKNPMLRLVALLFSSSAINGLSLAWIGAVICVFYPHLTDQPYPYELDYTAGVVGYLWGYAGIAVFVRQILQKHCRRISGFMILLIVLLLFYALPLLYLTLYGDYIFSNVVWNPPWISRLSFLSLHYQDLRPGSIGAMVFALTGLLLNLPLLIRGWNRNFKNNCERELEK